MQIHVVKPEDTLERISAMYSVPKDVLIKSNEIENPNSLVVGQTIVIPMWGSYYFVMPGDTLYSISRRYGVPIDQLLKLNNITNPQDIRPGVRLFIPQKPRLAKYSGAYIDTDITGENSYNVVKDVGELLSTVQLFSYKVNSKGELMPLNFEDEVLKAAKEEGAAPIMVITNIEDGKFSTEVATAIFGNEELENKLLDDIINIMKEKGYAGLDIDFEYLGAGNRQGYNNFLLKAKEKLEPNGFTLSTALAPKIAIDQVGVLYEGHDYAFHGSILDYIYFMTYEWGWVGGSPRAVAPLDEVKKVMDFAITQVPKEKIMMGIPLYGYDWTLPFKEGDRARAISSQEAIMLADKYNANIEFDEKAASPFFYYTDEEGKAHVVWFEDARSIQAKFDLVKSLGIRGFFYWVLGRDFPQNWLLLEDNFIVKKE
jgi:spore germination protein